MGRESSSKAPPDTIEYGALGAEIQRIHEAIAAPKPSLDEEELPVPIAYAVDDIENGEEQGREAMAEDTDTEDAKTRWMIFSSDLVRKYVEYIPIPRTDAAFRTALEASTVFKTTLKHEKCHNLHLYNAKMDGECKTQPVLRLPLLRTSHMQRCIKSSLLARTPDSTPDDVEIPEASIFLFADGHKSDNAGIFANSFNIDDRRLVKSRSHIYVTYDEASLMKRRQRLDTRAKVNVVETVTLITKSELILAPRKRLLQEGSSNQMNHIGPLISVDPSQELEWHLTVAEKRQFLEGETRKDGGGPLVQGEKAAKDRVCSSQESNGCALWFPI